MRISLLAIACGTAIAWAQQDAPEVNNPPSAQFIAKTPGGGNPNVQAEIAVQGNPNGTGAWFTININAGLALTDGPFLYHIHDKAVPADGNCTATLAHLDPYMRGETPPCQSSAPQTCQVGDLSGKHGKIVDLPGFSTTYTDAYISLIPGTPAYIGDKSFVLHYANKTRIMCVNFAVVAANSTSSAGPYGNSTTSGGSSVTTFPVGSGNATSTPGGASTSGSTVTVGGGGAGGGGGSATGPNTATAGAGAAAGTAAPASTGALTMAMSGKQSLGLVSLVAALMFALA